MASGGTNGARLGLSGEERAALGIGWLAGMVIVTLIITINIITRRHDLPQEPAVVPVIYEVSSALLLAVAFAIPAAAATWMHRTSPRWWRALIVHGVAVVAFAALHIGGCVALRNAAFQLVFHEPYVFGPLATEAPYEFAKDFLAYGVSAAAFWLTLRWRAGAMRPAGERSLPAWFDIRDGARLVRAPIGEILAVRSAGNYAEFVLSDGRRPLMRTSLAGLETRLAAQGFVRTHRSWLVNAARVTGLRPEGSGDYAVELGSLEAPLSRRFPQALAALRA